MEIHQLLPNLSYGDAISNQAIALKRLLHSWGHTSEIFTQYIHPKVANECQHFSRYKPSAETITIYHHSIGSEVSRVFTRAAGKRMMIYHNITPAHFFAPYAPKTYKLTKQGRESLGEYRDCVDMVLGDSAYNCEELSELGYRNPRVFPILVDFTDFQTTTPSAVTMGRFDDGWTNLLFVGRIAPNKCQEDVIRTFAHYNRFIDRKSRLFLVGNHSDMDAYLMTLKEVARSCGVEDQVFFTGHTTFPELVAYYRLADAFLCMSEHEGFCVPLLEAMFHDVPILAYNTTGVPYTLGDAGVLLTRKDTAVAAEMLHLLIADAPLRQRVIQKQRERLADFGAEPISALFKAYLEELIAK